MLFFVSCFLCVRLRVGGQRDAVSGEGVETVEGSPPLTTHLFYTQATHTENYRKRVEASVFFVVCVV
jgi:hypothetical protein